jgi:hypothetical protein
MGFIGGNPYAASYKENPILNTDAVRMILFIRCQNMSIEIGER